MTATPYILSSKPHETDDLFAGAFGPSRHPTPPAEGTAVRTALSSDHHNNPALKRVEQPHSQTRASSLVVSLPSEHESLATTPRPSMPLSPTPDHESCEMDVNVIRFQPLPGLWSQCKNRLEWSQGDAAAAIALNLSGMADFMESAQEALKEFITKKDVDDFYEIEGSGTFWRPISENLGCMVAAWGYTCPKGMKLVKERADKSYAEILEMWSQTHEHDLHVAAAREKAEKHVQNERLTLHNEIKHMLQELEKRKLDHNVVAGLADQLAEKMNEWVEKELSKVDLGLAGIRATLKALSGQIDDIATRGADTPTYAKATTASSAKGKEKEVCIEEPTKDPRKQPRAQMPTAEQKQGGEKEKDGPRDAKCLKDHATPDTVMTNILDLLNQVV
ncbi:hypothetical protein DAEQUDRAFT_765875 [Daedalea quercina L-15889]|uniref:Uncharacterized protein n=1 Tax=Daedalea quercina L-15889 TaxID=1314783 RepID=A0A165Q0T8_9APHY|nr:hypothetical protein DAEQUDRAFT_765875 [Daedalea quercina L-15889]